MNELFPLIVKESSGETCRTCVHRQRFALHEKSSKIIQCCVLKPSKRSNSGYKTIKVTNKACMNYETNRTNGNDGALSSSDTKEPL